MWSESAFKVSDAVRLGRLQLGAGLLPLVFSGETGAGDALPTGRVWRVGGLDKLKIDGFLPVPLVTASTALVRASLGC